MWWQTSSSSSSLASVCSWLCALLLTMMMMWLGRDVSARDLRRSRRDVRHPDSRRWGTGEAEGTTLISHMCAAQCNAFCNENRADCERLCRSNVSKSWIMNCHEQETEVSSGYYDAGDSYLTISSECPGTCSTLKDQEEAGYFIPVRPKVVLVRNVTNHSVTLTWSKPETPSQVVYVVQEKERNVWSEAHLVMGADHFTRERLDVCSRPTYRVAAVSRYGSYWFSENLTTPDMVPGRPENLHVKQISHDAEMTSFVITMAWSNPTGWGTLDLNPRTPFSWQQTIHCPFSVTFIPDVIEDRHAFGENNNTLVFHVADFVIGCRIIYSMMAHSKCSEDLISERAYLTLDFSCESVEDLYSGPYCTPPPFNPPGNVQNVRIFVFPGMHGARAHVTWWPPSDLGSAGVVGFYTVFYGFIQDTYGFMTFRDNFYQNVTLPGDVTEADIAIAEGSGSGEKFGILVMAGAPGQAIDHPIGIMNEVHATMSDGRVLLDEDIVVYQLEETREVRVYWRAPSSGHNATGVAIQWGPVNRRHADVIPNGESDDVSGAVTYNATKTDMELSVSNTTVIEENQTTYDIQGLTPSETYGIKMLILYDGEEADDIPEEKWKKTRTHVFVMPAASPHSGPSESAGRTSTKPHDASPPASQKSVVAISIAIAVVMVAALVLVALGLWCWRWKRRQKLIHLYRSPQPEYRPYSYFLPSEGSEPIHGQQQEQDDWEVPHSALKVGRVLGAGAFGQVLLGRVSRAVLRHGGLPPKYSRTEGDRSPLMLPVAIKMLKEGCEESGRQEFLREMGLMKEMGPHRHVVSMLGCCTLREPYCLLVEHMAKGDLLNYLKTIRNNIAQSQADSGHYENHEAEHVSPVDLLSIARQVALGMEFLADKGYVHRDLAARNVLIGEGNEVKVGDFGLARYVYTDRIYVNRKGGKLPLKWMAMESIFDLTFSTASDVWSFGVVLFEIVTLGGTPYPTLPIRELLRALKQGYRMERPDNCSEEMYSMMAACWRECPEDRPTFLSLRQWLEEMMADTSGVHYLDMDLDPARDYYTCPDSPSPSATSSVSEENALPLSPLFGKDSDSDLQEDTPATLHQGVEEIGEGSPPVPETLSTPGERDSLMDPSEVTVHKELSPPVSSGTSSTSHADSLTHSPFLSGVKSVRFTENASEEELSQTLAQDGNAHSSDEAGRSGKDRLHSELEDAAVLEEFSGCASPIPSPDATCDEVFTVTLPEKGWLMQGLCSSSRTGQPRVFPQERHPCSLFRTSAPSDTSSVSDDLILPLMVRKRTDPLDSQGESTYASSSSSSGESFSLPMTHPQDLTSPDSSPTLRPVASFPAERESSSDNHPKHDLLRPVLSVCSHGHGHSHGRKRKSNVYQQSPSQQRSRRISCCQKKLGQQAKCLLLEGAGSAVRRAEKDIIRPVVFSKNVTKNSAVEITAL